MNQVKPLLFVFLRVLCVKRKARPRAWSGGIYLQSTDRPCWQIVFFCLLYKVESPRRVRLLLLRKPYKVSLY